MDLPPNDRNEDLSRGLHERGSSWLEKGMREKTEVGILNAEESIKGFCAFWKRDSVQWVVSEVFWPSGFPYV